MRDDLLWQSIGRSVYTGLIAYVLIIIVAFARDLSRNMSVSSMSRPYAAVLRWYVRFSTQYRETYFFYYVEFIRLTTNLIICVLYVLGTFQRNVATYTSIVYRTFCSIFIVDLLVHIVMAESSISTVTSFSAVIDAVSFPSLLLSSGDKDYLNFAFLRAIPAFTSYARLERRIFVHIFSKNRLILKLCFKTLCLFYTLAASIQLLEIPGDLLSDSFLEEWSEFGDWNFQNSAYFIIVTLTTVGYGDFSPTTVQGRMYALFIIVIGIIVFSSIISELVEQANRDRGSGYFIKNAHTRHIIVTGNPTMNELVLFITEFYSDPRQSNVSSKVVVLVDCPAWSETEWFQYIARNQFLQSRLQFIMGSARNSNDLARARVDTADSVFILTSPSTGEDPSLQDTRTIMHVLAIRNVRNDVPIYAQTLLEESNLQTQVALSTVSCDGRAGSSHRNDNREQIARYPGLFKSVLQTEYRNLPRAYQGSCRRHMESILNRHVQRNMHINIHDTEDSIDEALRLSQHVCLQEIQMALIAGNIKANGVGTLLSNMYLEVPVSKLTKEDPGWLYEYLMGAASNLLYTIVPEELNGVSIKDIANDLFHVGIVILAISDPVNVHPHPVLSTEEKLRTGDLAMVLSYHERMYVTGAFHLVALRYARGELKHHHSYERNSTNTVTGEERGTEHTPRSTQPLSAGLITPSTFSSRKVGEDRGSVPLSFRSPPSSRLWISPSLTHIKMNISADDLDALAEADELEGDHGHRLLANPRELVDSSSASQPYIPENLKGHVIIAIEGLAPLENLPLLLRNLWHKDNRRSMREKKRERIVVIHPQIGEEFRKRFHRFERVSLFFVEGSPASRGSWRRAKLNTAYAVASIADITQPMHLSDARTIFTLLTLDVSTANDHDLFICSELIDEKSLEYLREPTHARRSGAALGESMENPTSIFLDPGTGPGSFRPGRMNIPRDLGSTPTGGGGAGPSAVTGENAVGSVLKGPNVEGGQSASGIGPSGVGGVDFAITPGPLISSDGTGPSDAKPPRGDKPRTIKFDPATSGVPRDQTEDEPRSHRHTPHSEQPPTGRSDSRDTRDASIAGSAFGRLASKALPKKNMLANMNSGKLQGVGGSDAKSLTHNPGESTNAANLEGADPNYRPGASRARRSTLFSRSRYASGELLVQSSALSLLAREYIEPGFVTFFTNLLGTEMSHPGMKIRLVRIPKSLFSPSRGYTCRQGRPFIRYNDVVQILIGLGVTPLGIYRSGNAPVLIPYKMRRKRGTAICQELEPLLEYNARESDLQRMRDENRKVIGNRVRGIAKRMKDVNPAKQREYLGREEIHGNMQHLFSLESSDEEFDDDDDDDDNNDSDNGSNENQGEHAAHQLSKAPTLAEGTLRFESVPTFRSADDDIVHDGLDDPIVHQQSHRPFVNVRSQSSEDPKSGIMVDDRNVLSKPSTKWGLGLFKQNSNQDDALMWRGANRETPTPHTKFVYNTDPNLAVPGRAKYSERPNAENFLPYVYTLPEPNTWCGENDGIFILCDPQFDLPGKWTETLNETAPI